MVLAPVGFRVWRDYLGGRSKRFLVRDGNSGACPQAWPGNAHCGAGLGKDIVARLVASLAGQDRDGTGPKRDGPKAGCGKTLRPATLFSFVSLVISRDNRDKR